MYHLRNPNLALDMPSLKLNESTARDIKESKLKPSTNVIPATSGVYEQMLGHIYANGSDHSDRTGTGRRSVYGIQMRFDLADGFPLVTTKKVSVKNLLTEMLWFLSGSSNAVELEEKGVNIWEQWTPTRVDAIVFANRIEANPDMFDEMNIPPWISSRFWGHGQTDMCQAIYSRIGTIGPMYGVVWRGKHKQDGVDQITRLIDGLKNRPFHSRHVVTALDPHLLPLPNFSPKENVLLGLGALDPCHNFFQCFCSETPSGAIKLSMMVNIRSMDFPIGTPYNVAQYAALLMMIATVCGYEYGELIVNGGDAHIYLNQMELVKEQLERRPLPNPILHINDKVTSIFDFTIDDFVLEGYHHHPHIPYPVSA